VHHSQPPQHDSVVHPCELLAPGKPPGRVARANEWLAGHLATVFGLVWTVWVFLTVPLIVLLAPPGIRAVVFYLASGWIQLWALPLFVYVGNRLQKSSDAQSDVQHHALTHIAGAADETRERIHRVYDLLTAQQAADATLMPPGPSVGAINHMTEEPPL